MLIAIGLLSCVSRAAICICLLHQEFGSGEASDQYAEIAARDSQMVGKTLLLGDHITIADFFVVSILLTLDEMADFKV